MFTPGVVSPENVTTKRAKRLDLHCRNDSLIFEEFDKKKGGQLTSSKSVTTPSRVAWPYCMIDQLGQPPKV